MSLRLASHHVNINIIQVYAPTSDYEDEEVEIFYEELEEMMVKVHRKDLLIVQGDWNAIVGNTNDVGRNAVGKFALGKTNPRGLRLLEFASKHSFTIANTLHPQKNSRKSTWHSPNGLVHNQIDNILMPQRLKSSIHKSSTRTYPGAVINSDHDLVLCNKRLKLRTQKAGKGKRIKYDVDKLSNVKTCLEYREELEKKLKSIEIDTLSTDKTYTIIAESITSTAQQVLGKYRKKIQPWITDDILDLCDKRRELKAM